MPRRDRRGAPRQRKLPRRAAPVADTEPGSHCVLHPPRVAFDPVTTPIPDYPSAHATAGGAAAAVLRSTFASDDVVFSQTSTTLPGITRSFTKLSQAASENSLSRIYVGYHFRLAVEEGLKQGDAAGRLVVQTRPQPL